MKRELNSSKTSFSPLPETQKLIDKNDGTARKDFLGILKRAIATPPVRKPAPKSD